MYSDFSRTSALYLAYLLYGIYWLMEANNYWKLPEYSTENYAITITKPFSSFKT